MFGNISLMRPAARSASAGFVRAVLGRAVMVRCAVVAIGLEVKPDCYPSSASAEFVRALLGKSGDGDISSRAHRVGGQLSRRRWMSDGALPTMSFS